jgi:hypothetical protein
MSSLPDSPYKGLNGFSSGPTARSRESPSGPIRGRSSQPRRVTSSARTTVESAERSPSYWLSRTSASGATGRELTREEHELYFG